MGLKISFKGIKNPLYGLKELFTQKRFLWLIPIVTEASSSGSSENKHNLSQHMTYICY